MKKEHRALLLLGAAFACRREPAPDRHAAAAASSAAVSSAAPAAAARSAPSAPAEPDTLTSASALPEGGPPVIASGKVDGAALRKRHIERLKTDVSPVTVLSGDSPLELGERLCRAVVPERPKATPILIKPNICGFDSIKDPLKHAGDDGVKGRVTEPEFVRGVVRCLRARGHTQVTIAEGCGLSHQHWQETIAISGFEAMAREEGIALVAMDDDGVFDKEGEQPGKPLGVTGIAATHVPTLLLPKILAETLDHGLFISVPKIKAHRFAVVSLGIKGMQGTVMLSDEAPAYKQKWRMHDELKPYLAAKRKHEPEDRAAYVSSLEIFAQRMVDVLEISTPDVVLAEGAPAMMGDGFQKLREVSDKVAIGGTNPVLVDRVAAEFMGMWNNARLGQELGGHRSSPLIEVAARRYKLDLQSPAVAGDGVGLLKKARPVYFKAIAPFAIDSEGALGALAPKPSARAAALAEARVVLDGRGDEPAWQRARPVVWETDYAGKSTGVRTTVRFVWSKAALYALFELEKAGLYVDRSRPTSSERSKLYEEDCVELFLTPDSANRLHYFEIEIGPLGHWFDLEIDRQTGKSDTAWSSGLRAATTSDPAIGHATIELELTAREIVAVLVPGATLPLGLYRMEGKANRQYLAWSPPRTAKPNFHVPEAFGELVIERPP